MAAGVDSLNVVAAAAIACCVFAGEAGRERTSTVP